MDPLSLTLGIVGAVPPTLHGVRLLVDDIQKIRDAPDTVNSIRDELLIIDTTVASLEGISDAQWQFLGKTVATQAKTSMSLCTKSCVKFRAALGRWTQHSGGELSWRDRAVVGVFKQGQIQSMLTQLQSCKTTLTSVNTMASLQSSLAQARLSEETMAIVSNKATEFADTIAAIEKRITEVNTKLGALALTDQGPDETEEDESGATIQISAEKSALEVSHKLLEELISRAQAAVANTGDRDRFNITFGDYNKGVQIGGNVSGPINNTVN
ncbi:hypothetical protein GQ53DRAFT_839923 [Thozetella sp. PMI_491]|nr:hypothetical protein GQ53DRAFT_839923 [Thozetella sp. PMI_491]